jgi:hypothetical protein
VLAGRAPFGVALPRVRLPAASGLPAFLCVRIFGAEDGIRTHDPNLGKVADFIFEVGSYPVKCCTVHPVSTTSSRFVAVVERSTNYRGPKDEKQFRASYGRCFKWLRRHDYWVVSGSGVARPPSEVQQ